MYTRSGKRSMAYRCPNSRLSICLAVVTFTLLATAAQSKLLLNGTDCTIREPLYNVTFDFNALSSDLNHHVTSEENGERFFFNVCDKDQPAKDNRTDPRAYLVRGGKKITLGYEAHLQLDNGRMQFSFLGEPCGNGTHYTLDIILLCSYERTPAALRVIPHTPDQCRYYIFWDTPLACQPLPTALVANRCTVRDGTNRHLYNLLPLGSANHEVSLSDGTRFVVSVCKPVRYGHLTMCPPGVGVCLVNGTNYQDYGQTVPDPKIDASGRLVMEMRSKSGSCQNSLIVFECGKEEGVETGPIYRGRKDNCTHEFVWRTSLACRDTRPCTVSNPITGTQYDLSLLANRTYTLTSRDNRTYEVGVCRIPASSQCPLDAGACEVSAKQSVGLGVITDELQYETTGAPYLLYRSGAVCDAASGRRWETRLEFICETDPVEGGRTGTVVPPIVVENGECQLVVHFETVLVCEPALMACGAYNESTIDQYVDLSPLMDSTRNYEARTSGKNQDRRYFLNVCRPLVPQYGLSCRGGAAACEASFDGVTARNETTLGFPDVSLVVAGDTVLMKYLRGDPCPNDPVTNLSTTVTFRCVATAGRGTPVLVEIEHGCHYRFDWPTAVICPPERTVPFESSNCSFHNPATASWMAVDTVLGELSLCDKQPDAFVDYHTGSLIIHYTEKDLTNCSSANGVKNYNVTVVCAPESSLDRTASTTCFEIITKQSPLVCALVGRNASKTDDATTNPTTVPGHPETNPTTVPDLTTTEPVGKHVQPEGAGIGAFGIVMICLTVVTTLSVGTLYLVRRHPDRCHQLHSLLLCRGIVKNDFPSTLYSRVDNSESSSLLLNASNVMSDSDDDMLI